jgi:hypothetical protein
MAPSKLRRGCQARSAMGSWPRELPLEASGPWDTRIENCIGSIKSLVVSSIRSALNIESLNLKTMLSYQTNRTEDNAFISNEQDSHNNRISRSPCGNEDFPKMNKTNSKNAFFKSLLIRSFQIGSPVQHQLSSQLKLTTEKHRKLHMHQRHVCCRVSRRTFGYTRNSIQTCSRSTGAWGASGGMLKVCATTSPQHLQITTRSWGIWFSQNEQNYFKRCFLHISANQKLGSPVEHQKLSRQLKLTTEKYQDAHIQHQRCMLRRVSGRTFGYTRFSIQPSNRSTGAWGASSGMLKEYRR